MYRNCIDLIDGYELTGTPVVTAPRLSYTPRAEELVTTQQGGALVSPPPVALVSASA